jgi:signal peptidase I
MESKDIVVTEAELSAPGGKTKDTPQKIWAVLWHAFLILLFTFVLAVSAQITYDYSRYQSFFVNGESMYPTLNADVTFTTESGVFHNGSASDSLGLVYTWGNFDGFFPGTSGILYGTYVCDYGLMDSKNGFADSINRFDIVVTYYDNEFSNGVLSSGATMKIKRVLALPGESFYFDGEGELYILNSSSGEYEKKEQTFLDDVDSSISGWKKATIANFPVTYQSGTETKTYLAVDTPFVLGDDEYFVVGDNRLKDCSSDSRVYGNGPVSKTSLIGKAVVLNAKCAYTIPSVGSASYQPLWNTFRMPWDLRYLDE